MESTFLSNAACELYTQIEIEYATSEIGKYLEAKDFSIRWNLNTFKGIINEQFCKEVLDVTKPFLEDIFSTPTSQIILDMANLEKFEIPTTVSRIFSIRSLKKTFLTTGTEITKSLAFEQADQIYDDKLSSWNERIFDEFACYSLCEGPLKPVGIDCRINESILEPKITFYKNLPFQFPCSDFAEYMVQKLKQFFSKDFEVIYKNRRHMLHSYHYYSFEISILTPSA